MGSDADLVDGFRRGDPGARAALYDRYADHVHRVLYRTLGFDRDLADLHHDVFVRALGSLPRLEDPGALKGWLTMIAVHVARGAIARRKRRSWLWFLPYEDLPEVDSGAASGLKRLRAGAYHTCYEVANLPAAVERLRTLDFAALTEPVPAVAFEGRRVVFLWSALAGLIER